MNASIRIWQWPNVLALDAALIAVVWQQLLARAYGVDTGAAAAVVLAVSVWLTYMADRLFDVSRRPEENLLSRRHRFAKRRRRSLWLLWAAVLGADIGLAGMLLSPDQLLQGSLLLALCLAYTACNQFLFPRAFPKELCVALIFASGVLVFLPGPLRPVPWLSLSLVCFLNCLLIAGKERKVDAALKVESLARFSSLPVLLVLGLIAALVALGSLSPLPQAFVAAICLLMALRFIENRLPFETYRVCADGVLLLVPLVTLSLTN